jgi:predicted O-methyltransferase YrrM
MPVDPRQVRPRDPAGAADDALLRRPVRDRAPAALERLWDEVAADRPGWQHYRLDWLASRRPGAAPLTAAIPWVTFPALDWLRRSLPRAARVFEWGCGGSTLFFARRAALLVSVEHDHDWHRRVEAALEGAKVGPVEAVLRLARHGAASCRMVARHAPAEPAADPVPEPYRSGRAELAGLSFERYVRQIEAWPDGSFDLVLVDGRARPGCVAAAIPKVAPGGAILLDNADYPRYAPALDRLRKDPLAGWRELDLTGPGPFSVAVGWGAIVWQRP